MNALDRYEIPTELVDSWQEVRPKRYLDETREPDEFLVQMLAELHPAVRLAWEPILARWAMYEEIGSNFHFIVAIGGPRGEFEHASWSNTIGYLDGNNSRGVHNGWDLERWLHQNCDADQERNAERIRRDVQPQIREGSERLLHLARPQVKIVVDKE